VTPSIPTGSLSWWAAREVAAALPPLRTVRATLSAATGLALAEEVLAVTDLPAFRASAMDGWAFCGDPPWTIAPEGSALLPGTAAAITTGGATPEGTDGVLRVEDGQIVPDRGVLLPRGPRPAAGADVREAGSECRAGDVLVRSGTAATPAVVGLLAAAGHDTVLAVVRPVVDLLVLGDELLNAGPARGGLVRDALGTMLPPWLGYLGAEAPPARRVEDTAGALVEALAACTADLLVTTGSTGAGRRDHLHAALVSVGAELAVDGVDVRPGHPMLMARLPDGRRLVGLPGNPLAAVCGLVTLVAPAVRALAGLGPAPRRTMLLATEVTGHPRQARLVPVDDTGALPHIGPAMLRGLAAASAIAVIPPGGAVAGSEVEVLALP